MNIEETIKVINQMRKDGIIEEYALGGAVAAILYVEPFDTQDVDFFVQIVPGTTSSLTMLTPIYEYLQKKGYQPKGEHIDIEDFPVQILPVFNALTEEAVNKAQNYKLETVTVRIMRPEHLIALMLDAGRVKDFLRINMFIEQAKVDIDALEPILKRHRLWQKWLDNAYRFV